MTNWLFTARKRFTPVHNPGWSSYLDFSGFTHITEVVTLDAILCPDLITNLTTDDWSHNIQANGRLTWFTNLPYLRQRLPWQTGHDQLLAILECPTHKHPAPPNFEFCGFDILDGDDGQSVLTNCGQFPSIFQPTDVNPLGLLSNLDQANTITAHIRREFPTAPHCQSCRVWQIARDIIPEKDPRQAPRKAPRQDPRQDFGSAPR